MSGENLYDVAIAYVHSYVYDTPAPFESLSSELKQYIQGWRPRLPVNEFPDDFPDDDGYTGDYFTLYRGMCFRNEEEYSTFMKNISDGLFRMPSVSSWTTNQRVAAKFARGAGLKEKTFYKGIVLEINRVELDSIFFSVMDAHDALECEMREELSKRENAELYSSHEDEMVLLPGTYQITVESIL